MRISTPRQLIPRRLTPRRLVDGASDGVSTDKRLLLSTRSQPDDQLGLDLAVRGLKANACAKALPVGFAKLDLTHKSMKYPENPNEKMNSNKTTFKATLFETASESETTGTVDATVVNALQKCLIKGECE